MSEPLIHELDETRMRLLRRPKSSIVSIDAKRPSISFEFFPPKEASGKTKLMETVDTLTPLQPNFVSVTYGAGGSDQEKSFDTVKTILDRGIPVAAHLTCVGASRKEVDNTVMRFLDIGVKHIVALRGDPPAGASQFEAHPNGYQNAAELVSGIRKISHYRSDLFISVAAYPEQHPQSLSIKDDLENLKKKLDAGANQAITQCFFSAETFLHFRDQLAGAGIYSAVVPGILPITNFSQIASFCKKCNTTVPKWMTELFADLESSPEISEIVSATVAAELCARLIDNGVNSFHFYTLNRAKLSRAVCHILGIRPVTSAFSTIQETTKTVQYRV